MLTELLDGLAILGSESLKERRVKSKVRRMSNSELAWVQHEVQYAFRFYDAARNAAQNSCRFSSFVENHLGKVDSARDYHERRAAEIRNSPLYNTVRSEMRRRHDTTLKRGWTGWIGLRASDAEAIDDALADIQKERYPIIGVLIHPLDIEARKAAPKTIKRYHITGCLVGDKNLDEAFLIANVGEKHTAWARYIGIPPFKDHFEVWREQRPNYRHTG